MRNEFTAVVERAGRWHIAYYPEIPGANGQGRTKAAALKSLAQAIALILEDRRKHGLRGVPVEAVPRHAEIPDILSRRICRGLPVPEIRTVSLSNMPFDPASTPALGRRVTSGGW